MLRSTMALGPLLALFFMPLPALAAPATPCFKVTVQYTGRDYSFTKDGMAYYVWHYRVTGAACINRGLSHWVLDLCPELYEKVGTVSTQGVDNSAPGGTVTNYRYGIGKDPTTGIAGLKWDYVSGNAINVAGEYDDFSFVAPGNVGSVNWSAKGSTIVDSGQTQGPVCGGPIFLPVPTDLTTWGTIKARFRR